MLERRNIPAEQPLLLRPETRTMKVDPRAAARARAAPVVVINLA
jgi:hypothetical protein